MTVGGSLAMEAILLLLTFLFALVLFYKYKFSYWKRKHLFQIEPTIPFGNITSTVLQQKSLGEQMEPFYYELKSKRAKYGGMYTILKPVLIVQDPDLIKLIMTKEFQSFHDRDFTIDAENDPVSQNIFTLGGNQWRIMRTKLSPTFTSGKLKNMFEMFLVCSEQLTHAIDLQLTRKDPSVDIKEILARFTTDVIGSTAFGLECNSLKNPDAEFRKYGKLFFRSSFRDAVARIVTVSSQFLMKVLRLRQFNADATEFFIGTIKETIEYRERNGIVRNDLMNLLIRLKNNQSIDDDGDDSVKENGKNDSNLTFEEIAAHAILFFLAGFETSSSTMTYCLYELSQNQEIQENVRKEMNSVLKKTNNGKFTYDSIMEMNYLNKVIKETLRKYPIVTVLNRKCVKQFQFPDDGFVIDKGTSIFIPCLAMQRDPDYFPDPMKFDPERFSEEEIAKRHPYTYLPFGEGPRNCIGMRFGLLQTKLGLATLLRNYKFTLDPRSPVPIKEDPKLPLLYTNKDRIWLRASKI